MKTTKVSSKTFHRKKTVYLILRLLNHKIKKVNFQELSSDFTSNIKHTKAN